MSAELVPELLRGVWQRQWIRHSDGTSDSSTIVVWLQLESLMADIRVPADHVELQGLAGLAACDRTDLMRLLEGESSSGYTTCTSVETDRSGVRTATAEWSSRTGFQPVTAYPEPGLIEWSSDGTVMTERAPSGDYVEEWHLVPGSRDGLRHIVVDDRTEIYLAGPVAIRVVDRPIAPARIARLSELAFEMVVDAEDQMLRDLVNCEFSLAYQDPETGAYRITASTLPWLIDTKIGVQ